MPMCSRFSGGHGQVQVNIVMVIVFIKAAQVVSPAWAASASLVPYAGLRELARQGPVTPTDDVR
jgi:hypothetical protein